MFRVERGMGRTTMRIFMSGLSLFRSAIALALLALFASCAEMETAEHAATAASRSHPAARLLEWRWRSGRAEDRCQHLRTARLFLQRQNILSANRRVSTGKPGFSTPPGHYQVVWKNKDHVSTVFRRLCGRFRQRREIECRFPQGFADRPARISMARGCPTRCFSGAATRCTRVTSRPTPPPMVAFACPTGMAETFLQ